MAAFSMWLSSDGLQFTLDVERARGTLLGWRYHMPKPEAMYVDEHIIVYNIVDDLPHHKT